MNGVSKIAVRCMSAAVLLIAGQAIATDQPEKEARITRIIRDVKLLPSNAEAKVAALDDKVQEGTAVRTGNQSRSELTFADLTITRLGENTIFSFNEAGRSGQLESGVLLLCVPKDSGGASMTNKVVTVGITGTTVIFDASRADRSVLIILEGGARLSLNNYPNASSYIRGGQMLTVRAGATRIPPPVKVDLRQLMQMHPLITDFAPLPSLDLILANIGARNPAVPAPPKVSRPPAPPPPVYVPSRSPGTGGGPQTWPVYSTPTPSGPKPSPLPTQHPIPQPTPRPTARPTPRPTSTPPRHAGPPIGARPSATPRKKLPKSPTPTPGTIY